LTNAELRQALGDATAAGAPIDVVHLDGCLMGLVENAYQLRGLTRYLIASENLGWSSFGYQAYRAAVGATTSPAALSRAIVDAYAQDVAGHPFTIAAYNLAQVDTVTQRIDALSEAVLTYSLASPANRARVAALRAPVQKLDSSGDIAITPDDEYVDLAHWLILLRAEVGESAVQSAAGQLQSALSAFVIREAHASGTFNGTRVNLDQARGVGIYYPATVVRTYQSYRTGLNFPQDTRWDEVIAAQLAPLPFDPNAPGPAPIAPLADRMYLPLAQR
jgi:hypothetical protein